MFNENDEELKKKKERARQLRNSVGFVTSSDMENMNLSSTDTYSNNNTSIDSEYLEKLKKVRQLRNSVGFITPNDKIIEQEQNILQSNIGNKNIQNGIDLSKYPDLEPGDSIQKSTIGLNTKGIEGIPKYISPDKEKEIQNVNTQTVNTGNLRKVNGQDTIKMSVANTDKINNQNATKLTNDQINALSEAKQKNENIKKGGVNKFNEIADTILSNIQGGLIMKPVAGLYNVITTAAAFGVRGLEGAVKILGFENAGDKLNNIYNDIIESGNSVKAKAEYSSTVTNQIDNNLIKTAGNVTDIVSNVVGNAAIGYATGVSGAVAQGITVGGSSAQEVLDENKDNIVQASLTGIAKGYVSYFTENMFDANILTRNGKKTSIEKGINKIISNTIKSNYGKEFANKIIGILGENAEELAEDNAGYLIDKLINNKDMPGFKEWWKNTTETAKMTTISTIILELLGLGGGNFNDIEKDEEAKYWIEQAQQIIDKENLAIHFNTDEIKNLDNTQDFYISKFKQDGEFESLTPTRGKEINNPNTNLNVSPAIVKDNQTNLYNVIDGNTGVVLDSTLYNTTIEAENSFNEKVNKLSPLQIKDINNKIAKANFTVTNKLVETINQAKSQINGNTYNINSKPRINNELNDTLKAVSQIQDNSIYKNEQANNIFRAITENLDTINYISQSGNNYLNSLAKSGKVVYQQKLNKKLYTGSDIKNVIYNAIANADIQNEVQTTIEPNTDNLNVEPANYINEQQKDEGQDIDNLNIQPISYDNNQNQGNQNVNNLDNVHNEDIKLKMEDRTFENVGNRKVKPYQMEYPEIADEIREMAWNFQEDLAYTLPGKRFKIGDEWTGQKRSTTKELAEIKDYTGASWEQIGKALDDIANNKGNYALAKRIELVLDKALTEGYRNIYRKDVSPNKRYLIKKGKIEGIDYDIEDLDFESSSYYNIENTDYDDEDNVIKEQIIPSKNGKVSGKAVNEAIKEMTTDYDVNRPIKGQIDVEGNQVRNMKKSKMTDNSIFNNYDLKTKERINSSKSGIVVENIEQLHELINEALSTNENKSLHLGKLNEDIISMIKRKIQNLPKEKIDYLKKSTYDLVINQSEIRHLIDDKKTLSIKDVEHFIDILPVIITNSDYISYSLERHSEGLRFKKLMEDGTYVSFVLVSNKYGTMKIKTIYMEKGDYENKKRSISLPNDVVTTPDSTSETSRLSASNINNSIPQKEQNVKNETVINKKSMQKEENNTSNDDIRSMKKPSQKVEYDNQGRILTKEQQEYFKDSKVRDENGKLLVMYHGTEANVGIPEEYWFTIFDIDKAGNNGNMLGDGFYFTSDKSHAKQYSHLKGNIYETYLNIKNPLEIDSFNTGNLISSIKNINPYIQANIYKIDGTIDGYKVREYLLDNGYDGIHSGNTYVAFRSNQIKNITNNSPTSNDDIRYMKKDKNQTKNTTNKPYDEREQKGVINETAKDLYQANLLNVSNYKAKTNAEGYDRHIEREIKELEKTNAWDYTIPPTSRTDIRKTIEDYLGIGIQKGHFRQRAYGIYKVNRDVIRTKEYKDIDSILHEAGHAMDLGSRISVDKESIANELLIAVDRHGGYEKQKRSDRLDEGFAEVIREYAAVPEQAKIDYPQTITVLEGIRKNDKSFDKFIGKVQQQIYNYIHQSPRNRELANQSIGKQTDKQPLTKEWIKQKVIETVWDKDYGAKMITKELAEAQDKKVSEIKASENMYYLIRLSNGIGSKAISMLSDGYIDIEGNKLMPGLNKIGEILGNNPERFNDLRAYLVAQRDLEYKVKSLKTGLRTTDSKAIVNKFKNDEQIQEAASLIYDTIDGVMQYAVKNSLIDGKTAKMLKKSNVFYVPMQRVLENDTGNNIGKRGAVQNIIKKRTGSELDIKDVLENIITNSINIIQQVENNNVLKALYNEGEQDGLGGLTGTVYDKIPTPMMKIGTARLDIWEDELKKQGVKTEELNLEKTIDLFCPNNKTDYNKLITSFIDDNGQRIFLQFMDKSIFTSIMGADKNSISTILKISRHMNMPLRFGATMGNLTFAIPNMISDTVQATIYSKAGFIPIIDNAIGVLDVLTAKNKSVQKFMNKISPTYTEKAKKMYTLYNQSGASFGTRMSQYRKSAQEQMENVYGTKSKDLGIEDKFKPLKNLLDILSYIPELSEQSTRLRVFEKNYDYYKNKGNSETDARILAALESRDATQDFSRSGSLTKEINQLIPFSSARVGSAYTFTEKISENPKVIGMKIAILTAIAMGIKSIGYDDDEIEELNQRKKDDNFVLKMGDKIVTIKKPQGILRSIINLAEYIQDLATGHIEEGKEGEKLGNWLKNALMDNMPADEIGGYIPNVIAPIIENWANKDLYYNTDIVKSSDLDLPNKDQYYDYNSQLAILLGQIFNYSPAKIDNLISGYLGGLGTTITDTIDYWLGKAGIIAEKPEMGAEKGIISKRFIVNVNSNSQSIDDLYNLKTELTKKKNGGTITDEESKQLEDITQAISQISSLNKQIKSIKANLIMSGEEKAEKIKALQSEKTDTARQVLGKNLIDPNNATKIEATKFYPTRSTLKNNGYILEMSTEMQKEYEQVASDYYNKYAKQGLYNNKKLEDINEKAKEYAKKYMMKKYKNQLIKSK